ncbi:MAG: hypothetical protein LBC97_09300 [Bifidobacteriaceae bacterium]|jgi:hypothetical protein|nr:hypothetical protein [Bifidobacteriaceae bacterium]
MTAPAPGERRKLPSVAVNVLFAIGVPYLTMFAWVNRAAWLWALAFVIALAGVVVLFLRFTRMRIRGKAITGGIVAIFAIVMAVTAGSDPSVSRITDREVEAKVQARFGDLHDWDPTCAARDQRSQVAGTYILYNPATRETNYNLVTPGKVDDIALIVFTRSQIVNDGTWVDDVRDKSVGAARHWELTATLMAADTRRCLGQRTFSGGVNDPGGDLPKVTTDSREVSEWIRSFLR